MKAINQDKNAGCTPISSNCVIWQGPCIACINVNTGDTVSDVIYDLATTLCGVQTQFDLSDLDLQCLVDSSTTVDKTINVVLELIITKLCGIVIPDPTPPTPEVIVTVAPCFQTTDLNGDLVTTMTASNYAKAIGIKVCSLVTTVTQQGTTITNHESRITVLENANHDVVIPQVTPVCVVTPGVSNDMDVVLEALESQFCQLRAVTGMPSALSAAIGTQCVNLNSSPSLSTGGTMSGITGWKSTVSTVADSLNNLWLTICDMRAAVDVVQNCCAPTCADITVDFLANVADNGATLNLYFSGYTILPAGFIDCTTSGSVLTITDGLTGTYTTNVNLVAHSNSTTPLSIPISSTPLNPTGNYTFTLNSCVVNGSLSCSKTIVKTATGTPLSCSIPSNVVASIV